jgi:N-acetylmuramoyl-L-alanine amidase
MANYIILDAGHAKVTAGKRSPDGSLMEWEFNNAMQYKLKARLEQLGFTVYLVNPTPEKGAEVSLATRCSLANSYYNKIGKKNCLYVSLHANAAGSGGWSTARGVEVFTSVGASSKSVNAAKKVCNAIYKDVYAIDKGFKNRGHKANNFYVVKNTNSPAILIEYEFYSNKDGVALLKNKRDLLCEATLKGICEHFGVTYKAPSASVKQPVQETAKPSNLPSTAKPWKNGTYNAKVKVTASSLNVRAGRPNDAKYSTILGQLKKDQVVTVGYCLNGWFGVIFNGKQGFISGDYVKLV